jgi:outer membrane protein
MGVAAQNDTSAQTPGSSGQLADSLPAQWDLQTCIDYALPHIIHTA